MQYWFEVIAKLLLFLAGLAVLLDLVGPDRVSAWAKTAWRRRHQSDRHLAHMASAARVEAFARRMAQRAAYGHDLRPEDVEQFTSDDVETWIRSAHDTVVTSSRNHREAGRPPDPANLEAEARSLVFGNTHVGRDERLGLMVVDRYIRVRRLRFWTTGVTLFAAAVVAVPLGLWIIGERHPVLLGTTALGAGWTALAIGAGLQTPRVMVSLARAESMLRLRSMRVALRMIGDGEDSFRPMHWAAVVAFVAGSLLDLATSL